jgi:L-rhamnose isomerase
LGAVYDGFCARHGVPAGFGFMDEVKAYEKKVLAKRG